MIKQKRYFIPLIVIYVVLISVLIKSNAIFAFHILSLSERKRNFADFMEWKNTNKRKIVGNVKSKQKAKHLLFYFIIGLNGVNQALVSEK